MNEDAENAHFELRVFFQNRELLIDRRVFIDLRPISEFDLTPTNSVKNIYGGHYAQVRNFELSGAEKSGVVQILNSYSKKTKSGFLVDLKAAREIDRALGAADIKLLCFSELINNPKITPVDRGTQSGIKDSKKSEVAQKKYESRGKDDWSNCEILAHIFFLDHLR
jgi:hypothetical protein